MLYLSTCTALTPHPTPVLKGEGDELEGRNLESELYVFSQATKNLLDSSEKNGKLLTMFVNQNILARVYTDKIIKTLCIHK